MARVATRRVGIDAGRIARVLPMLPLWRPPTTPAPVRGFVPVAGSVLPVLCAQSLLGLGEAPPPTVYAHILMLDRLDDGRGDASAGGQAAGLLVDRAEGFAAPATFGLLDPADTLGGCAVALFGHGEGTAWLVDPDRLLDAAEQAALARLAADAARRRAVWDMAA